MFQEARRVGLGVFDIADNLDPLYSTRPISTGDQSGTVS
jgi:hypothetical protein